MAYSIVDGILSQIDSDVTAAEAHGVATGMLCIDSATPSHHWLDELLADDISLSDEERHILCRLFEETRRLLLDDQFEFSVFLPEDDQPLAVQAIALKTWCQGFLFGLGSLQKNKSVSAEAQEIIKDITELTKLDPQVEGEEDEIALTEITEYLRSAVLLLRDELDNRGNQR